MESAGAKNRPGTDSGSAAAQMQAETQQGHRHLGALGTIYPAACACRKLFEEYLSASRAYYQRVSVCQRQFLIWTKFSGVFADISVSLDAKLRGMPEMKELFFDLLEMLQTGLETGIKYHGTDVWIGDNPLDDDVMYGIEGAVSRLTRLSHTLQTPRRPDAIESVLRWRRSRGPDGFDESILALLQRRFRNPAFLMAESLQIQLASTIAFRRDRLKYYASHEHDNIPKQQQATQQPKDTTQSQHTLFQYPEAPAVPEGDRQATCSLCFKAVPRTDLETDQKWRAHVNQDLRPYICISEQCGNIAPAFPTYMEWRNHMANYHSSHWAQRVHRPYQWVCPFSHDVSCHFNAEIDGQSEQRLLAHMQVHHSHDHSELELVSQVSFCKVLQPLDANVCLFCGAKVSMDKTSSATASGLEEATSEHIANHLESIAMWSLYEEGQISRPKILSVKEGEICVDGDQIGGGISSSQEERVEVARRRSLPDYPLPHAFPHEATMASTFQIPTRPVVDSEYTGSGKFERLQTGFQLDSDGNAFNSGSPDSPSGPSSSHGAHEMETRGLPSTVQSNYQIPRFVGKGDFLKDPDYLEDQMSEALVASVFPEGYKREFIPNDKVEELVTERSVTQALLADEASDEPFRDEACGSMTVNDQTHALVGFVLKSAKKLFMISLMCGMSGDRLRRAMESFHLHAFSDKDLPLTSSKSLDHYAFRTRAWSALRRNLFMENQWKLLVPVFSPGFVRLHLEPEHILPFVHVASERREGTFGNVYQVTIHPSHQEDPVRMADGSMASVAIKEMKVSGHANSRFDAVLQTTWQAEANALEEINGLGHEHIVPVKAVIIQGTKRYFMFQWADGGNLRDLYDKDVRSTLTSQDVQEVIAQLSGVVDALYAMHHYQDVMPVNKLLYHRGPDASVSYRHGDLKPENILRMRGSTRMGVWKIGDMGLAKRHQQATEYRRQATTTYFANPLYQAPEVYTQPHAARSRLYDIWAMGCITLELIIWLLYGPTEVVKFNNRLSGPSGGPGSYWVRDKPRNTAKLHPVVLKYIDHIKRDPECRFPPGTALGDLLRIVETKLLVMALPSDRTSGSSILKAKASDEPETIISDGSEGRKEARLVRATAADFRTGLSEIRNRGNHRGLRYIFSGRDRKGIPGPSFNDRYSDIATWPDQQAISSSSRDAAPNLTNKMTDRALASTVASVQLKTSRQSNEGPSNQTALSPTRYQPVYCVTR